MARIFSSFVLTQLAFLVLFIFSTPTDALSLSMEDRLHQLTEDFANYKIKMEDIISVKDAQFEMLRQNDEAKDIRLVALELKVEQQQEMIVALQQQIAERSTNLLVNSNAIASSNEDNNSNLTQLAAATGMPKSCADLAFMGHKANGLYLIMGTQQVETVYCDFTVLPSNPSFQKWIGQVDVKSLPVHFFVKRYSGFTTMGKPIPFEEEVLNIGNAMNIYSGKFTAPRDGIYFLTFTAERVWFPAPSSGLDIVMYLNGNRIATGYADEVNQASTMGQYDSISLHSTPSLHAGDQIWLEIYGTAGVGGQLMDGGGYTHFTGWLLDENISQLMNVL